MRTLYNSNAGANVIIKLVQSSIAMLRWNKALLLGKTSHKICNSQSERFISKMCLLHWLLDKKNYDSFVPP